MSDDGESVSIRGRLFPVAADADVDRKIGGTYSADGEHPAIDLNELSRLSERFKAELGDPLVALYLGAEAFEMFKEHVKTFATIADERSDRFVVQGVYAIQGVEIRLHASIWGRTVVPVYRYRRELTPAERFRNPFGEYTGQPFKLAEESKP